MVVDAARIALPDFDAGAGDGRALAIEQPAEQVGHLTRGPVRPPRHLDEIGIGIERQGFGVERPCSR